MAAYKSALRYLNMKKRGVKRKPRRKRSKQKAPSFTGELIRISTSLNPLASNFASSKFCKLMVAATTKEAVCATSFHVMHQGFASVAVMVSRVGRISESSEAASRRNTSDETDETRSARRIESDRGGSARAADMRRLFVKARSFATHKFASFCANLSRALSSSSNSTFGSFDGVAWGVEGDPGVGCRGVDDDAGVAREITTGDAAVPWGAGGCGEGGGVRVAAGAGVGVDDPDPAALGAKYFRSGAAALEVEGVELISFAGSSSFASPPL